MDQLAAGLPPLRILHCIASLGGGGAENQLATLCESVDRYAPDLAFHVAHIYGGVHLERIAGTRAALHPIAARGHHDPRIVTSLANIIRENRIDLVQTWLPNMDVLGGVAARLAKRPVILSERSSSECYHEGWKITLRRMIGKRAAAIVANSPAGICYWEDLVPPERLHLIPNAINPDRLLKSPPFSGEEEDFVRRAGHLVVFAGRLTDAKNLDVLCDAFQLLLAQRNDVTVLVFGDGERRDHLAERMASVPRGRIQLMGFSEKLPTWLRAASLFVSLSKFEGQPNVVLEAACLHVPQVLSDIPQHRGCVGDNGAFFTPTNSADQASLAMMACLEHPQLRERKVAAAHSRVADLGVEKITAQYETLYRQIAGRTNRASG